MAKSVNVWVAVNKSGFMNMFTDEPFRNKNTGKWEGTFFINSVLYPQFQDMVEKANLNWDSEPEPFTINLGK